MNFLLSGGTGIAISTICIPFVTPALRRICLPYVPATTIQLENIQRALKTFAHKKSGNKLVDIGSGDGRIVHLAAQNGYKAHGIELNPWLVLYSKYRSLRLGIRSTATFSRQDLWKSNFHTYDSIVIFGVEQMVRFEKNPRFINSSKEFMLHSEIYCNSNHSIWILLFVLHFR